MQEPLQQPVLLIVSKFCGLILPDWAKLTDTLGSGDVVLCQPSKNFAGDGQFGIFDRIVADDAPNGLARQSQKTRVCDCALEGKATFRGDLTVVLPIDRREEEVD
jgi:hypothetical protein